jgi:acyl-CoA thioesterase-1
MKVTTRYGSWRSICKAALFLLVLMSAAAAAQDRPRIVALGDSLTAGYGLAPEEAFPPRLEAALKALGVDAEVVNAGVSGDTTAGGLARIDWALADTPDYVLVELGANDGLRGIDPKTVEANLDAILTRIKAKGAKPILFGMAGFGNWGREYQEAYASLFPRLAERHGVPLYPFFLEGVAQDPALNLPDGMHPNAKGVEAIVARIAPFVARHVREGA